LGSILAKLAAVNFLMLTLYLVFDYLEWRRILGLPLVAALAWFPLRVEIWFGGSVPVIVDGLIWLYRFSFVTLLTLVAVDLIVIWKLERKGRANRANGD
jgi:ABC-type antimicrobial peptide transport system permease subunit